MFPMHDAPLTRNLERIMRESGWHDLHDFMSAYGLDVRDPTAYLEARFILKGLRSASHEEWLRRRGYHVSRARTRSLPRVFPVRGRPRRRTAARGRRKVRMRAYLAAMSARSRCQSEERPARPARDADFMEYMGSGPNVSDDGAAASTRSANQDGYIRNASDVPLDAAKEYSQDEAAAASIQAADQVEYMESVPDPTQAPETETYDDLLIDLISTCSPPEVAGTHNPCGHIGRHSVTQPKQEDHMSEYSVLENLLGGYPVLRHSDRVNQEPRAAANRTEIPSNMTKAGRMGRFAVTKIKDESEQQMGY